MSDFAIVSSDMAAASGAAGDAAVDARSADGSDALTTLAGGLPGSTSADVINDLATAWSEGTDQWAEATEQFAASIEATSAEASTTDGDASNLFGGLLGPLGQPR